MQVGPTRGGPDRLVMGKGANGHFYFFLGGVEGTAGKDTKTNQTNQPLKISRPLHFGLFLRILEQFLTSVWLLMHSNSPRGKNLPFTTGNLIDGIH